jgi:hypothetical protein
MIQMAKQKEFEASDAEGLKKEVLHTSDRTAAIVLASWVERELEQWIIIALPRHDKKTVENLQGRDGALNSFYSKIHLGYALALYDETTRANLDIIRRVRNAFAHTPQPIDFETDEIRKEVENLNVSLTTSTDPDIATLSEHRRRFTTACARVLVRSWFEPLREGLEFLQNLHDAISTTGDIKAIPPNAAEKLAKALEAFERFIKLASKGEEPNASSSP